MLTEHDLIHGAPLLADGTTLDQLVDREARAVALRVMNDPEVHQLELQRIFARAWVAVGHDTEIPNPGDFVLRWIGEDSVIVTRDRDGGIRALLNVCAHRGMEVCWADDGNASSFKCPYHGWAFDSTGRLLGAPFEQEMYGDWDKRADGLRTARVDTRHGVVFATFDHDAPSLDDYLGDIARYLDASREGTEMEAAGPPFRTRVEVNWKAPTDQLMGDSYHNISLHRSLFDCGFMPADVASSSLLELNLDNVKVSVPGGHAVYSFHPAVDESGAPTGAVNPRSPLAVGIFPTTSWGGSTPIALPDGSVFKVGSIGGFVPRGYVFEYWQVTLVDRRAPEALKASIRSGGAADTAMILVDDFEAFPKLASSAVGAVGRSRTMNYNAVLGERRPDDWPGPGVVHAGFARDDTLWNFWLRWYEALA